MSRLTATTKPVKSPTVKGINAAFWLMCGGANSKGVEGASDGAEIDILETYDITNSKFQHAIHWDGYSTDHQCVEGRPSILNDFNIYDGQYHTYGCLWTEEGYTFYVDGIQTWHVTGEQTGGVCQVPVYLKLTLGVGGSWVGEPDAASIPTDGMVVDYVKVWQLPNS